jgi:hypothetical protein
MWEREKTFLILPQTQTRPQVCRLCAKEPSGHLTQVPTLLLPIPLVNASSLIMNTSIKNQAQIA